MAGMLAGVECARRRRFHQSLLSDSASTAADHGSSSRRSSFCLYTTSSDTQHHSSSFSARRSLILDQGNHDQDEELAEIARVAKEKLDHKFRSQIKSETRSENKREKSRRNLSRVVVSTGEDEVLQRQREMVLVTKRSSGSRRFSWTQFRWRSSHQEECVICLDEFKSNETLMHLPCAHRFHSNCVVPWLENNSYCPCCRLQARPN